MSMRDKPTEGIKRVYNLIYETIDRNRTDRSNNLGKIMSHKWGEIKYDPKMHAAD